MNTTDMNKINNWLKSILIVALIVFPVKENFAGNEQRAGQAGASELLINPWARSSGWAGANVACVRGLEGMFNNVAGLAFTPKTELIFSRTNWLAYNDNEAVSYINTFGFSQKVGEGGVLALGIMSLDFGDIEITTEELPNGGIGTFSPKFMNIGLSYAKVFSNSIYGGFTIKMISEQISNVRAGGVAFDAGIQYVTGAKDNLKFGISLKNIGPRMSFSGDGLTFRDYVNPNYEMAVNHKSAEFELPSLLNIGLSYDAIKTTWVRWTGAATFTSNAFQKDQYRLGTEFAFRDVFMIRCGYTLEEGLRTPSTRTTALRGPSGGFTIEIPMGRGKTFGVDYSYRHTDPFQGSHALGARINL